MANGKGSAPERLRRRNLEKLSDAMFDLDQHTEMVRDAVDEAQSKLDFARRQIWFVRRAKARVRTYMERELALR